MYVISINKIESIFFQSPTIILFFNSRLLIILKISSKKVGICLLGA